MTYGHWLGQAHHHLGRAHEALPAPAAGAADIAAALTARHRIYNGLARLTELLAGGAPARADLGPAHADAVLARAGPVLPRLYVGLSVAGRVEHTLLDHAAATSPPARHLTAAAHAIVTAGDILASHVDPARRPRTPEGAAIRAGAGVDLGLGDIARLAHVALAVDAQLPTWLHDGAAGSAGRYGPTAAAIAWTTGSGLPRLVGDLLADTAAQPNPLHLLTVASAADRRTPTIHSVDDAAAALLAARDWLYRNPGQVRGVHLAAATRLGLTLAVVATVNGQPIPGADPETWRRAAGAARSLHGTPATGPATEVVADLDELTRWVRNRDPNDLTGRRELAPIAAHLPNLAVTLRLATLAATDRGELFTTGPTQLVKTTGTALYHALGRWRPAHTDDEPLPALRRALAHAGPRTTPPNTVEAPAAPAASSKPLTPAQLARLDTAVPGNPILPAGRQARHQTGPATRRTDLRPSM